MEKGKKIVELNIVETAGMTTDQIGDAIKGLTNQKDVFKLQGTPVAPKVVFMKDRSNVTDSEVTLGDAIDYIKEQTKHRFPAGVEIILPTAINQSSFPEVNLNTQFGIGQSDPAIGEAEGLVKSMLDAAFDIHNHFSEVKPHKTSPESSIFKDERVKNGIDPDIVAISNYVSENNLHVWLFGSRSNGTAKPTSDIDLMIDNKGMSLSETLKHIYAISNSCVKMIDIMTTEFADAETVGRIVKEGVRL